MHKRKWKHKCDIAAYPVHNQLDLDFVRNQYAKIFPWNFFLDYKFDIKHK